MNRRRSPVSRTLVAAVVVAGCAFVLLSCAASDPSSSAPPLDSSVPAPGLALAPEMAGDSARQQAPAPVERKEIVTGQLSMIADDPIAAGRSAAETVTAAGGRIDNRTESPETDDSTASSSLTARIPADELDATVDAIRDLGEVTSLSVTRDDVTMQYQDLDARISALQASVDRLRALIAAASNTADLIEAESALSSRQGELDSLVSQKNYLMDQIDLSTLTISFTSDAQDTPANPDNFWDAIVSGWHSLAGAVGSGVLAFGAALPWLAALAVIAAAVYGAVRLRRRSKT
ncbi:DUF4349 domain-containing protein [Rhodococcus sp. IEGM 1330]|uniref:DUF4349 domain-containing protein n=1 Tax=Rhodococcus sp. IEGM 1330 TaxID=3082225 RepID=UPI002953147A|nr:DUF4349 domain-containing protein [Rhodococcus sp. IEGM 1330]MDV8020422.1 DUF4349 domain-containing protein [Rhodococcus sp. IEGM 1330]